MTRPFPTAEQGFTQTHLFRVDWRHSARQLLRVLYGFLAFIGVMVYSTLDGTPLPQDAIWSFAAVFGLFVASVIVFLGCVRENAILLIVGPDGISVPSAAIGPIDCSDIVRVSIVLSTSRYMQTKAVRFHFKKDRLNRRQFLSLRKNQWDIIVSSKSRVFGWDAFKINGGSDALIDSIARYTAVKGRLPAIAALRRIDSAIFFR